MLQQFLRCSLGVQLNISDVHSSEIFCATFLNDAGSQDFLTTCIKIFVQMFIAPAVVWKLLLRGKQAFACGGGLRC